MKGLMLNQQEQGRLQVMNLVMEGQMGVAEAANILGLSERHAWRILTRYRKEGAAALAHGNRGHRPLNSTSEEIRERIIMLARTHYTGVNHTHLTELLEERDGIALARSTIRKILINAGMASPRHRRPPIHRCRRERMPREGVLVQIDGSYHSWLENRGPWLTLLLAVDDATGTIPYALFREHEDAQGYFRLLWGICQSRGIPLAIYTDRHSVFQPPRRSYETLEESLAKERGRTQVGRALRELGVCQVFARSPEAKGRVERMAGTFQDRLVSELRMAGASTMAEANNVLWQFLPGFNVRFGVPPAQMGSAYRLINPDMDLAGVLCFKHECKVARDNTIKYHLRTLQLLPGQDHRSYAGARAEIQVRLDGNIVVYHDGQAIATQEASPKPDMLRDGSVNWSRTVPLPKWLTDNGGISLRGRPKEPKAKQPRYSTPLKIANWKAVQAAKRKGFRILTISKALGLSRRTVRRYLTLPGPPVYSPRRPSQDTLEKEVLTKSLVTNT